MTNTDHNQYIGDNAEDPAMREMKAKLRAAEENLAQAEMPRYKCHKEVHALKIAEVIDPTKPNEETDGSRLLRGDEGFAPIRVDHEFVRKHKPEAGGYYVVYADGYKSFSPAKAFEDGYTRCV